MSSVHEGEREPRIPHVAPMRLVDRVIELGPDHVIAEKRVTAADALAQAGLGGVLLVEALAQAAACLHGVEGAGGGAGHRGYLVAAQGWKFQSWAPPGALLRLEVRRVAALGSMHRFEGRATVDGEELASGSMTLAIVGADPA